MDKCTASTLRVLLIIGVAIMAALGLWSLTGNMFCNRSPDRRRCNTKAFAISASVLAAGIFLTSLVIIRAERVEDVPTTTDLMNNVA